MFTEDKTMVSNLAIVLLHVAATDDLPCRNYVHEQTGIKDKKEYESLIGEAKGYLREVDEDIWELSPKGYTYLRDRGL